METNLESPTAKKSNKTLWIVGGCGCLAFAFIALIIIGVFVYLNVVEPRENEKVEVQKTQPIIIDEIPKEKTPPPKTTTEVKKTFDLYISSVPEGAQVFLDGQIIHSGKTPVYTKVEEGKIYQVKVQKFGYKTYEENKNFDSMSPSLHVELPSLAKKKKKKTYKKKKKYYKKDKSWGGRVY